METVEDCSDGVPSGSSRQDGRRLGLAVVVVMLGFVDAMASIREVGMMLRFASWFWRDA